MHQCVKCGDYGMPGGCPKCHKDTEKPLELDKMKKVDKYIRKTEFLRIPEDYVGIEWDVNQLKVQYDELLQDFAFNRFLTSCAKLHESFKRGSVINKSVFICAPPLFGKEILAYSCMQHAINNGLKVAPYLDSMDLKRLLVLGAENPHYKIFNCVNYDEYITSDIVFVSVTHTAYKSSSFSTILELMTKRSRLGLPTYIISEVTYQELVNDLPDYQSSRWTNPSDIGMSYLKYPVNITYVPLKHRG